MHWTNAEIGWPWLCLGGSLALFTVMLFTDVTRADRSVARWMDPVWLSWIFIPVLLLHVFEEYGVDMLGRNYAFAEHFCVTLGFGPYPDDCPIPRVHYAVLNLGMACVGGTLAALWAKRNLMIGLSFYGIVFFNGFVHLGMAIKAGENGVAGLLSGLLFLPFTAWMAYVVLKTRALSFPALLLTLVAGIVTHISFLSAILSIRTITPNGLLVFDFIAVTIPFLIAGIGSKFLLEKAPPKPTG